MEIDSSGNGITEPVSGIFEPTMELRWRLADYGTNFKKTVPVHHTIFNADMAMGGSFVLQQKWKSKSGEIKWIDVPLGL